jgi:hypothetical protein
VADNSAKSAGRVIIRGEAVPREFNVLALVKGGERYVYVYDDGGWQVLIDAFRDQAADPQLSLNWFDASVLTEKTRQQARANAVKSPVPRARI